MSWLDQESTHVKYVQTIYYKMLILYKFIIICIVATFKFYIYYDLKQIFEILHKQYQKVVFNNSVLYKFREARNYLGFEIHN